MTSTARRAVVSYNLHGCRGRDNVHDIARCVAVVAATSPAVVGLQEVDSRDGADVWNMFGRELGLHAVPGPTLRGAHGEYGNLLLSRFPCRTVRHHDLAVDRREPRRAIDAEFETAQGPLRVIVTHLGLRRRERSEQIKRLAALLRQTWNGCPLILLGDFNEWLRGGRNGPRLHPALRHAGLPRSFPAHWPRLALDQIWSFPAQLVERVRAADGTLARIASDHLPVVGQLNLGELGRQRANAAQISDDEPQPPRPLASRGGVIDSG